MTDFSAAASGAGPPSPEPHEDQQASAHGAIHPDARARLHEQQRELVRASLVACPQAENSSRRRA